MFQCFIVAKQPIIPRQRNLSREAPIVRSTYRRSHIARSALSRSAYRTKCFF